MRRAGPSLAIIALAGCAVQARSTTSPKGRMSAVVTAEAARDAYRPALRRSLVDQDPNLRQAALRALARIEEAGTTGLVTPLLGDRNSGVAKWAAFATGQIGEPAGLVSLLQVAESLSVTPGAAIRALARAGTATTAREVSRFITDERHEVRAAAALTIGLIAKRLGDEVPGAQYTEALSELVMDPEPDVRFGAVYALMRMPGADAAVALTAALADDDPEIRATAVRGLGDSGASVSVLDAVLDDADWRVRLAVAKALSAIGSVDVDVATAAASRLSRMADREVVRFRNGDVVGTGTSTHVLLAIIDGAQSLGDAAPALIAHLERFQWNAPARFAKTTAADRARLHCGLAYARDALDGVVRRVRRCGSASLKAWRRWQMEIRLLSRQGPDAVEPLLRFTVHADPRVRASAVEALGDIPTERVASVATALLAASDPYVVAGAAGVLSQPDIAEYRPAELLARLRAALVAMVKLKDANFAVSVLDAVAALGPAAAPLAPKLEQLANDPRPAIRRRAAIAAGAIDGTHKLYGPNKFEVPFERPKAIDRRLIAKIRTSRGTFTMRLLGDVAPVTVGTFVSLVRAGFYDGKTFHRVVSGFVAQGGCPRGDGWGGPGYTIEEETSILPFRRGAVGIATNGRDTGGSQLFVMHAYHPHLDGGYTVFAQVIDGMTVVDALQEDDRIVSIGLEDDRRTPGGVQ